MGWLFRNPHTQQERRVNSSREYRRIEIQIGGEFRELRIRIRGSPSISSLGKGLMASRNTLPTPKHIRNTLPMLRHIPGPVTHGTRNRVYP